MEHVTYWRSAQGSKLIVITKHEVALVARLNPAPYGTS
jgi:hypothetical protein